MDVRDQIQDITDWPITTGKQWANVPTVAQSNLL